jgi:hypothetical protein
MSEPLIVTEPDGSKWVQLEDYIALKAENQRMISELDQDWIARQELDAMLFARTQELKKAQAHLASLRRVRERVAARESTLLMPLGSLGENKAILAIIDEEIKAARS